MWQDWILMLGGFAFSISLLDSILSKRDKPSRITSITTFLVLIAFCICYVTLGLWLATLSTGLTSICWLVLFFQKGSREWKERER